MHAWMKYYFELVGDQIPNSNGEIHLEPQDKYAIYTEYVGDHPENALSYPTFIR